MFFKLFVSFLIVLFYIKKIDAELEFWTTFRYYTYFDENEDGCTLTKPFFQFTFQTPYCNTLENNKCHKISPIDRGFHQRSFPNNYELNHTIAFRYECTDPF